MLRLKAPAKINLALEVLGRRADGYHEIKSVIQSIELYDELTFEPADSLEITGDVKSWDGRKSLISKAANLLQERCGLERGGRISIRKRIPLMSGLGGDSSDGAAALKGFNRLWQLGISDAELMELGASLGSDVPFFFCGGTALIEGRGEIVLPLRAFKPTWVVLLLPTVEAEAGKTARLYGALKNEDFSDGSRTEAFAEALIEGRDIPEELFGNTFERPAAMLWPEIGQYRRHFIEAGATEVHLSGAGPALFSLHRDNAEAARIYRNLAETGATAYLARTCGHLE
jgi:4-diphosphocytidyl-2-C-methyl-D-erythritol kinase